MKILFLVRLYAPHVGGVEKHVGRVVAELVGRGHNVTVVTEAHMGEKAYEMIDGVSVHRIPVSGDERAKKFEVWKWFQKHRNLIQDADVVHCHDVFFWYLPFRFFYPRKRVFVTFHGYEGYPIRTSAKIQRRLAAWLVNGNISVGKFIQKWYGTQPTYVTYGAVDLPKSSKSIATPTAAFIGRLEPMTGIRAYSEAAEIVKTSNPAFSLQIAGYGSLRTVLSKNYHISESVTDAIGFLERSQFAFVSGYLTILEALVAKRLVFAYYDNPLKEDYLRMTPYADSIIVCNSPAEIAQKVEYYLAHPKEAEKLTEKGYNWASTQSWEQLTNLYLKLWNRK